LMTSEMDNTDKVIKNLAECREKGIEVLPPDINESRADFTVVGDKIRFGLAAVKNVGEKAVEVVLESCEREGSFKSLFDFCRRVDLGAVNRRVVESLIKCGAFDSMAVSRARMMAALDEAMKGGQSYQRGRQSDQIDIFDAISGKGNGGQRSSDAYPKVQEWSEQQLMAFEKESLGFYITAHPLDKYERTIRKLTSGSIVNLRERPSNGEAKVGGVVTALKLRNTKKGERYASFQLEDRTGFIEVIVWPALYRRCMETLVLDDPILVQGRLEVGEERAQLIANEITPLAEASHQTGPAASAEIRPENKGNGEGLHFFLRGQEVTSQELSQLHQALLRYPGTATVFLHLFMPDRGETIIELPLHLRVASTPALLDEVERIFGNRIAFTPLGS